MTDKWINRAAYSPVNSMDDNAKQVAEVVQRRADANEGLFDAKVLYCFNNMFWFGDYFETPDSKPVKGDLLLTNLSSAQLKTILQMLEKASEEECSKLFEQNALKAPKKVSKKAKQNKS